MRMSSEMSLLTSIVVLLQRPQVERLKANSDVESYGPRPVHEGCTVPLVLSHPACSLAAVVGFPSLLFCSGLAP